MIHISPYRCTEALFQSAARCLGQEGILLTYGPYNVDGTMVESNVAFDESLRTRNSSWGIRRLEEVELTAKSNGFGLEQVFSMPANNLCVTFRKS